MSAAEVRSVGHLYFIPLGEGRAIVMELTCRTCGVLLARDARRCALYSDSEINAVRADLTEVPPAALVERRALEQRAISGRASPQERASLIAEVFTELQYLASRRERGGATESVTALVAFAFIVLAFLTMFAFFEHWSARWALAAGTAFLLAWLVWRVTHGTGLAARRYVLEPLAGGLRPLKPTREELERVMLELRGRGVPLARALNVNDIQRALEMPG